MKKHLIIVSSALVIVSIIVIVFGLCYKQVNYSTFHFSPMMCEATFDGMSPEDFCTNNGEGTFLKDKYFFLFLYFLLLYIVFLFFLVLALFYYDQARYKYKHLAIYSHKFFSL